MVHIPDWHMVKRGRRGGRGREIETMHVGVRFTKTGMV